MKKLCSMLIVSMMIVSVLSVSASGADKMVEISVMLFDRGNTPAGEGSIDNNRWTQYINQEMAKQGIKVNFVTVPRSEENQKIPVMMASQTAADIMMTYNATLVEQWYQQGGLHNLSDALEKYGQDLIAYNTRDVLNYGKTKDGAQYAIPARRAITAAFNGFIRKDWLDALGLKMPETPDELYVALKTIREKDPGKVGSDKIVGYGYGNESNTMFAFIEYKSDAQYATNYINLPSGSHAGHVYAEPGFKQYFAFLNKLYNEKLMDPEFFTSQFGQKEKEAFVAGTLAYWESNVGANVDPLRGGLLQNLRATVPTADMVAVPPFKNVHDGQKYVNEYPATGGFVFVPKTAKHVDACMKYLNFLAGEGGKTIWFGFEGVNYKVEDGVPVPIDVKLNATQLDWIHHDLFLVGNQGYFKTEDDFIKTTAKTLPGYEQYLIDDYTLALAGQRLRQASNFRSPTEIEQSGNLDKVNADYRIRVITCKPNEFDALYEKYQKELAKYDIEKVLAERAAHFGYVK